MKSINQYYTQYINRKYKRSGKLWENRYKLHLVDPDYEWVVARYIELNPVRARMITNPTDYHYSSAKKHLKGEKDSIVSKDIIEGKERDYLEFIKEEIKERELKQIRDTLKQGKVLGSDKFISKVEKRFGGTFRIRGVGRPVKIN